MEKEISMEKEIKIVINDTEYLAEITVGEDQCTYAFYKNSECMFSTMLSIQDAKMDIYKQFVDNVSQDINNELRKIII